MLLPALSGAKARAQGTACSNNLKQFAVAWLMYADDNNGLLVNNSSTADTRTFRQSWVNNIQDWGTSDENTNPAYVLSGKLAPYVNNSLGVYKCPSDRSMAQNGPRLRSISMNALVGDPLIATNRFNPTWLQFLKIVQFPSPANFYVFLEEHPDTINDGYFMNRWDAIKWGNLPASFHGGAANISWADGHVERHRWLADTIRPPVKGAVGSGGFVPSPATDYEWLRERTSLKLQ
jgi:prepilin-type processing-associated H-X9-DG protein